MRHLQNYDCAEGKKCVVEDDKSPKCVGKWFEQLKLIYIAGLCSNVEYLTFHLKLVLISGHSCLVKVAHITYPYLILPTYIINIPRFMLELNNYHL